MAFGRAMQVGQLDFQFNHHKEPRMSAVTNAFARPRRSESEQQAGRSTTPAFLPANIAQAVGRLLTSTQDWALNLCCAQRSLLARIVGLSDKQDPAKDIYVRRTTLASWIGVSVATIQRLLLALEQAGWIKRDQVKSRRRGFQVGEIRLTAVAISRLFGTDESCRDGRPGQPTEEKPIGLKDVFLRRSSMTDALLDTQQCLHRQPDKGSFGKNVKAESSNHNTNTFAPRLPHGLMWLKSAGITPAGICALMRRATASGNRLEDVAIAVKKSLKHAKNPYAYLHALVAQSRNWRASASKVIQQAEEQKQSEQQAAAAEKVWRWIADLDGVSLIKNHGTQRYTVIGRVVLVSEAGQSRGAIPLTVAVAEKFKADWEAGKLVFEGLPKTARAL